MDNPAIRPSDSCRHTTGIRQSVSHHSHFESHGSRITHHASLITPHMPSPSQRYLTACDNLLTRAREQEATIQKAADWFADTILRGQMVHVFASGHSRIMVEEMWPRYGSFPGFNP